MCVSCGQGEGAGAAEEHMFFTCPHAQEVWTRLQQTLAQSGGTFDPTSPADLTCTTAVTAMGGKGCTRVAWLTVWVGALWAIWRRRCALKEERTPGPKEKDGSIWCGEV